MLDRLEEAFRRSTGPDEIIQRGMRILREELNADRCAWAEVEDDDGHFRYLGGDVAERASHLVGRHPVSALGDAIVDLRRGGSCVCHKRSGSAESIGVHAEIMAHIVTPIFKNGRFVAAGGAHMLEPREWTSEEVALVEAATELCWDAIMRARCDPRRHDAFFTVIERAPFNILCVNEDLEIICASEGASLLLPSLSPLRYCSFEEVAATLWPHPLADKVVSYCRGALATGESGGVQEETDGSKAHSFGWRFERVRLPNKQFGVVCYLFALSQGDRQERQVQALLREVNHRSKNLLGFVQAIARQMSAENPRDFAARFAERLQSLSRCQDLLIENEWQGADIRDILRAQIALIAPRAEECVMLAGPPLMLAPNAAQTLGAVAYELLANAIKYGSLGSPAGTVSVEWAISRHGRSEERLALEWRERGGPRVIDPPQRQGFGMTVIGKMARLGLGAEVSFGFYQDGFEWRLDCPTSRVRASIAPSHPA